MQAQRGDLQAQPFQIPVLKVYQDFLMYTRQVTYHPTKVYLHRLENLNLMQTSNISDLGQTLYCVSIT